MVTAMTETAVGAIEPEPEPEPNEDAVDWISNGVIKELDRIADLDADNLIEPETVVEFAKDISSPLHRHFLWDDSEAAHQYRLVQARSLINRIKIIKVDNGGPRYVNVIIRRADENERRGYVQTKRAVADESLYDQIVKEAINQIRAYRIRLSAFERAREGRTHGGVLRSLDQAVQDLRDSMSGEEEEN